MSYFTTYQINDHIFQIKDPMGVLTTLVIGKDKALLVDTAYGIGDLNSYIRSITDLPLIVVNSHGHMDHSCGNYQFDEVFIDELDWELCVKHNGLRRHQQNLESAKLNKILPIGFDEETYVNRGPGNLVVLKEKIIDLGLLTIEIVPLPGHTRGSIGFLIKEDRLLITSDAICPWVWLFLEESTSVEVYLNTLKSTLAMEFDGFLLGHGAGQIMPKEEINKYIDITSRIDLAKSIKVSYNHFEHLDSYCFTDYTPYEAGKWGIMFSPDKL